MTIAPTADRLWTGVMIMKRVNKKRDVRVKYTLSDKQLDKIKAEVTKEAVTKTGMLYLASLAEKGWDEEQIVDLFETISRYTKYTEEKVLKLKEVQEIIERRTGMTIKGKW